jgi:hypothetical protein
VLHAQSSQPYFRAKETDLQKVPYFSLHICLGWASLLSFVATVWGWRDWNPSLYNTPMHLFLYSRLPFL